MFTRDISIYIVIVFTVLFVTSANSFASNKLSYEDAKKLFLKENKVITSLQEQADISGEHYNFYRDRSHLSYGLKGGLSSYFYFVHIIK